MLNKNKLTWVGLNLVVFITIIIIGSMFDYQLLIKSIPEDFVLWVVHNLI